MRVPRDADAYISGSYYKVGLMEKAFIFLNGEWVLCSQPQATCTASGNTADGNEIPAITRLHWSRIFGGSGSSLGAGAAR